MKSNTKNDNHKDKTILFYDHMNSAWENIYTLEDLELKYPFFRLNIPKVSYVINKDIFKMIVDYSLTLSAKKDDAYVMVDFRRPHDYMLLRSDGKIKTCMIEAQEEIMCDSKAGYESVRKFFKDNGVIMKGDIDYNIRINDDILIFDDHNSQHRVFRGWTGGYDPGYGGPDDISNVFSRKLKKGWDTAPYYASLEKRINTLKMLFDGINSYAKFDVDKSIRPTNKIPDFKKIYYDMTASEIYGFMKSFGSDVAGKIGVNPTYDITIMMSGKVPVPRINFIDNKSGIFFYTEWCGLENKMICCELHMPLSNVKVKDFDRTYLQYNEDNYNYSWEPRGTGRNMIGVYEYVNSLEDIPAGLQRCFERLGYIK
jgi:hypothetical protein